MKIFILIDQLHSHGGIEKLVAMKANYWTDIFGYEVKIISTEQGELATVYNLSGEVQQVDLNISYNRSRSFFHPENLKKLWINKNRLLKIIRRNKPDFILVASHIPMTYLLPFLKTDAIKVKEFHYSKFSQQRSWKEKIFEAVEKYYDYLVVLSREEKMFYTSQNALVIPNPVNNEDRVLTPILQRKNIAVAALRFAPVKQIEKMVEVWELFYRQNPSWELHLYGETGNEYYGELLRMVTSKKLESTIVFKGQSDDIHRVFCESQVLLMTSSQECFPMVILEAQSCGVPVVSFDSPTGPRNIINHNKDGILVDLNNVQAFAHALDELVNNPENLMEMSQAAVHNAQHYQIDKVMNLWKNTIFEKNINA
ncbi:MAG: glycosyltransferase [Weeksellaceae bacterium]|nr:glycosyltransferase [Weeksellaceae bacterium]